ncbi:DCTN4 Dynactin subunit 4 [Candida maltosa Xu316]
MSRIYNNSYIYCSDLPIDLTSIDTNFLYPLGDLYFCPICQFPKPSYQTFSKIEYKFCSNCLTNYTDQTSRTTCGKNCFMCPRCDSNLTIKMNDFEKNGKSFEFGCVFCEYKYSTRIVYQPKSLMNIIKDEMDDGFHVMCNDIKNEVLKYQGNDYKSVKQSDQVLKNLELMNINKKEKQVDVNPNDHKLYPRLKKLSTKKTLRCLDCNNLVVSPLIEPSLPTSNKFTVKFNAIDYLPTITMSKIRNDNSSSTNQLIMLIHFINPLSNQVYLNISLPSSVPTKDGKSTIKFTIPKNEFTLGAASSNIINNIPSALLTTNTVISRSELILRKGDQMYKEAPSVDEIEENLDNFIEVGSNWYTTPIIITSDNPLTDINIPIHVSLKSEIPPESLTKITNKFSLGYWNILKV